MKKILLVLFLVSSLNAFANYTTPGTGKSWDLDSLVAFSGGNVTFSSGNYLINDTINISASDTIKVFSNATLKFGTGVFIDIFGIMIVNPPDSVKMTAQDTTLKYLGLKFEDLSDGSVLKKLIFEYASAIRMLDCDILIDNCIIRYNNQTSSFASGAISFFRSNSIVSNCKIFRNRRAGIVSGANIASSPQILNNLIYDNNTENANVPQINFGATGPAPAIIRGNTITGGPYNQAGGIAFSPIGSIPLLIIENNIIKKNRYGIAIAGGSSNVYINNNIIDTNNIQNSPNLGGSGINFNGSSTQLSVVTRNTIRGNLWGITIQGTAKPNMGDLSSPDTSDAGQNQIYGNGNSGKIFDLFNNTVGDIKAEFNYWGTSDLDSIESHIFHDADSALLGVVDYLPIRSMALSLTLGIEGFWNGTTQVPDTVRCYLRSSFSPYAVIDSAKAVISENPQNFLFTNAWGGDYYIEVQHRNSIQTWSAAPISFASYYATYNFTGAAGSAYGNNQTLNLGRYCIFGGDVNQDGFIELSDLVLVFNDASNFVTGYVATDVNGDNLVDLSDLVITFNNASAFVEKKIPDGGR